MSNRDSKREFEDWIWDTVPGTIFRWTMLVLTGWLLTVAIMTVLFLILGMPVPF